jgi:D-alanine--poly(phosphoribitol) ligase subunit 1
MENMGAIVVDESLRPVKAGEKGELCLTGLQLTNGYWKNPERNKEAFFTLDDGGVERRYYRTGDVAFRDTEGDFMFGGRLDQQVKIQGFRVELSEIEHHVREFTGAANVAAVADDSGGVGNIVIHLVVAGNSVDVNAISKYLEMKVPKYMIPAAIHKLDALPLNVNGKTDRKALLRMVKGQ